MELATLIVATIGAVASIAAAFICWWMPLSSRVRERFSQDEPLIDFSMNSAETHPQNLKIDCQRSEAKIMAVLIGDVTVHSNIGTLRPGAPTCPFNGSLNATLPPADYRTARIRYVDRWGREFSSEKDVETLTRADGKSAYVNTRGGLRVNRPPMGFREVWRYRNVI